MAGLGFLRRGPERPGAWLPILIALLFVGALFWAKGRDPFQRIWFKVKVPGQGKTECIAVLPRTAAWPLPLVVYLHGSGGSLIGSGNELRQMAEMGLAAVGMEYEQKPEIRGQEAESGGQKTEVGARQAGVGDPFEAQFTALLEYLRRQRWAETNGMAWVGYSLGAQRLLSFALRHPESAPKLLVRLAGGWVPEMESGVLSLKSGVEGLASRVAGSELAVLLVHGDRDEVFPVAEARRVAACLEANGVPVELKVLPGEGHGFGGNRLLLFRVIGERCLTSLRGPGALAQYQSILSWQAKARPLWLFWTPALGWAGVGLWLRWRVGRASRLPAEARQPPHGAGSRERQGAGVPPALRWWDIALRCLAAVLAAAAMAQTALHLVPPHLRTTDRTLSIAREHLVQPKELSDFDCLAPNPVWRGKPLKTLLEHVELAHYNRELINWSLDDAVYRQFVLWAEIEPAADGALDWRRPLWENFYPRIRKEQSPEAAAEIVVRFLRERVTIAGVTGLPATAAEIWQRQITDERGFEAVYVAALRSVGIPARLDDGKRAELCSDGKWQAAPRPLVERWR
jgi:predicted esterase